MRGAAPRPPNMFSYILPILTADNTREGAVQTNDRLRLVTGKVTVSYNTVKGALIGMHERYEHSKAERNVFRRYALLKAIVKEVIQLDAQYWLLLDVPKQDKQEQVNAYVLRACAVLEKSSDTRPQGETSKSQAAQQAEEEAREKDRKARLEAATVQQIEEENTLLINDLYRLLKKYANLRTCVHTLHLSYRGARMYPIFPRYNMLKDMIKNVLRDPSYMEVLTFYEVKTVLKQISQLVKDEYEQRYVYNIRKFSCSRERILMLLSCFKIFVERLNVLI